MALAVRREVRACDRQVVQLAAGVELVPLLLEVPELVVVVLEPVLFVPAALDEPPLDDADSEPVEPSLADELAGAAAFELLLVAPRLSFT
ncbi:MAG TPA: hypothetical protein VFN03_11680 [Trueperaceae bacterium]|nr:hypothetical protein [Trueperaceae bacterium]